MRSIILFLLLDCITLHGSGQASKVTDSIKIALTSYVKNDSTRLNLFLKLAKTTDSDSERVKTAEEVVNLAKALNLKNKLGEAYVILAAHTLELGNDSLALSLLNEALIIFQSLKDNIWQGKVYTGLARVFQSRDQYYKAIDYNQKALDLYEINNNHELIGRANLDLGVCYYWLSDYSRTNQYYLSAKEHYEKAGMLREQAILLSNLGQIESKLKKFTSAIAYYRSAMSVQNKIKDSTGYAKSLQGIGIVHDLLNNSDSALWYYYQALPINKIKNNKLNIAENLNNIGIVSKDLKRYEESYLSYIESLNLYTELNKSYNIKQVELNLAELFCTAPPSFFNASTIPFSKRYEKAALLFTNIISYAKEVESVALESKGWLGLSEMYKGKQDYKNAFTAYHKYVELQDSIINEEKSEATTKAIDKFEFEKKEAVIQATHQAEIKQQKTVKNALATGTGILTIGGLISFLFYKRKRDAVQKQKEAEFKSEVSETEMKALRSQMNPHFIFNSLNSIGDYIAKNNTKLADEYLAKFAKLMRLILENSEKKEVALSEDLKALELYMQLESLRMNQKFTYQVKVDEAIDAENTMIPPLILQPFVENSIWHGISKKEGAGNILVQIKKEGEMINCIVEDDGIGRKMAAIQTEGSKPIQKQSLGMKITEARINILNKVKNSTADIQLFDLAQGTRVEVKLPLELSF